MKKQSARKFFSLLCALTLVCGTFVGCGTSPDTLSEQQSSQQSSENSSSEPSSDTLSTSEPESEVMTFNGEPIVPDESVTGELNLEWPYVNGAYGVSIANIKIAEKQFRQKYPNVAFDMNKVSVTLEGQNEYWQNFQTQMMAGDGPDVILWNYNAAVNMNVYKMQQAGAFDDLMLYMENDPEWQKADYIKPVMDGVQYQGQQFVMPITYTIPMMLSTEEILKENNIALTSESNADEIITEWEKYWKNTNPLTGKPLSLRPSMYYSFDQWFHLGIVDFENQKVDLNSPYIKKMADAFQYGYELEDVHSINGGVNIGENMNSLKEQKLTSIVCEYDLDDYYRAVYHLDTMGTPAVIPMRDAEGKIHVEVRFMAGINANSQNKELAWEFIKCILSEENQYGITEDLTEQGTPVNKEACRRMGEDVFCKGGISVTDPFFGTYGIVLDHSYYEKFTAIQNDIASSYMLFPGFGITFNHIRKVAAGEETYEEAMKRVKSYYTIYVSE